MTNCLKKEVRARTFEVLLKAILVFGIAIALSGPVFGTPIVFNDGNNLGAVNVSALDENTMLIVYRMDGIDNPEAKVFDVNGEQIGETLILTLSEMSTFAIAELDNSTWVYVYQGIDANGHFQVYDKNMEAIGADVQFDAGIFTAPIQTTKLDSNTLTIVFSNLNDTNAFIVFADRNGAIIQDKQITTYGDTQILSNLKAVNSHQVFGFSQRNDSTWWSFLCDKNGDCTTQDANTEATASYLEPVVLSDTNIVWNWHDNGDHLAFWSLHDINGEQIIEPKQITTPWLVPFDPASQGSKLNSQIFTVSLQDNNGESPTASFSFIVTTDLNGDKIAETQVDSVVANAVVMDKLSSSKVVLAYYDETNTRGVFSVVDTNYTGWYEEAPAGNPAPTMDGVDLNEATVSEGQSIKITVTNPGDGGNDELSLYCSTTTGASASQKDFCESTGFASPYADPFYCEGVGAAGNGTQTIYCILFDGVLYSEIEYSDTYEAINPTVYGAGWTRYDELQQQNFLNFWAEFAGALGVMLLAFVLYQFGFKR